MTWVPGSSQTPASVVGFIEEGKRKNRFDLLNRNSGRALHRRTVWHKSLQSKAAFFERKSESKFLNPKMDFN